MKKLLLSLVILGTSFIASAQTNPIKFNIKTGLTFPKFSFEGDHSGAVKSNPSFYVGGTVDLPISDDFFSIQPGLLLSGKGFKIEGSGSEGSALVKIKFMYIEVPVNLVASFPAGNGKVFWGAGPYYGIAIRGKGKVKGNVTIDGEQLSVSNSENVEFGKNSTYKRGDFGLNFLAGYQLSNGFNIHGGYGIGLSSISQNSSRKIKNKVLSVGIGYAF